MLVTENFYRFLDSLELIIIKKLMTDDRLNAKLFFPLFLLQTSVSGVITTKSIDCIHRFYQ